MEEKNELNATNLRQRPLLDGEGGGKIDLGEALHMQQYSLTHSVLINLRHGIPTLESPVLGGSSTQLPKMLTIRIRKKRYFPSLIMSLHSLDPLYFFLRKIVNIL